MKNQPSSSIKNSSLFKLYDIQHNYQRHRQKISNIKNKNAKEKIKKQYSTQIYAANQLKKNWLQSQATRTLLKQKQISGQNQLLYNQIIKVRNRNFQRPKIMSEANILNKSQIRTSHSVNQQNSQKNIKKQNQKLMERLLSVKSPLSKAQMKQSYQKIKQAKKRLETYSSVNKSRIKSTLTKFNIKPQVYFPTIGNQSKVQDGAFTNYVRRSCSSSRLQKIENQFMSQNTVQKKDSNATQWQNQFLDLNNKQIDTKQKLKKYH